MDYPFKNYGRMCKNYAGNCDKCSLSCDNNKCGVPCFDLIKYYAEEAVEIIEKWTNDNPVVTNGIKFEEVFGTMKQTTPVHHCAFFKHRHCSNFMEGIIPCNYYPWCDEEYKKPESKKEEQK